MKSNVAISAKPFQAVWGPNGRPAIIEKKKKKKKRKKRKKRKRKKEKKGTREGKKKKKEKRKKNAETIRNQHQQSVKGALQRGKNSKRGGYSFYPNPLPCQE